MKLLTLMFLAFVVKGQSYPGIRASIQMSAFDGLIGSPVTDYLSNLTSAVIPNESFFFLLGIIPAKMTLSNITISTLYFNEQSSGFTLLNSSDTIYLLIDSFYAKVFANYHYHYPILSSGNVTIVFNNSSLVIPIKVDLEKGSLQTLVQQTELADESYSVTFNTTGFFSKLFGKLVTFSPLKNIAQHVYKNVLGDLSKKSNPKLKKWLNSIDYDYNLKNLSVSTDLHFLNYSLSGNSITLYQNGSFYLTDYPFQISPVIPPSYLPNFYSSYSFRLQLTEYFFDSFLWALYGSGALNFYVSGQSIPKSFPYPFTTTGLNKIIPNFAASYGPGLPVNLECSVYKIPDVVIQSEIIVYASVYCDFLVQITSSITVPAFRLLTQLQSNFVGSLQTINEEVYLIGGLDQLYTSFNGFTVVNSNIGQFNTAALAKAINWYTYYIVLQINNVFGSTGFKIPLPKGVVFQQSALFVYSGALEIGGEMILS